MTSGNVFNLLSLSFPLGANTDITHELQAERRTWYTVNVQYLCLEPLVCRRVLVEHLLHSQLGETICPEPFVHAYYYGTGSLALPAFAEDGG